MLLNAAVNATGYAVGALTDENFEKVWWMGKTFITSSTCGGSILVDGGGVHSFTLQLNVSAFYGTGGCVKGVFRGRLRGARRC